tara:strand:- start:27 stop:398 length:372 start_codon:yes stop_codon:yes gene_type:complete
MDNYSENIKKGWNYPEASKVRALGLSPIQTEVLHASCKFSELKIYRGSRYGLVKAISLQGVECSREQVIEAIHTLVNLGFIYVKEITHRNVSSTNSYSSYDVEANFQKIRQEYYARKNDSALF